MKTNKKSRFEGCWATWWSDCNSNGKPAGSARLAFKTDPLNANTITGAWTGTAGDSKGFKHCGFMIGKQRGSELNGTWYEVIYKDNQTCPILSYCGKFRFVIESDNHFNGTWTDYNGPCKPLNIPDATMHWNGDKV